MGARLSVPQPTRARTHSSLSSSSSGLAVGTSTANGNRPGHMGNSTSSGATTSDVRLRSRSVGALAAGGGHNANGGGNQGDSDSSVDEITGLTAIDRLLRMPNAHSHVATLRYLDFKCPVCHKVVPSDDVECHLVMCLTRPRIVYNEEVLTEPRGECVICFEELIPGDTIARLPCLCIYHKECIDSWFKVKNSCPEHPGDD